jgi:hypothetical protein
LQFLLSHLGLWRSLMMVSSIFFFLVTGKMHLSSFDTSSDSNVWIGFLLFGIFSACNKCCSILTNANNHKYYSTMLANANQTTVLDFKRVAMPWSWPVIVHSAAYEYRTVMPKLCTLACGKNLHLYHPTPGKGPSLYILLDDCLFIYCMTVLCQAQAALPH